MSEKYPLATTTWDDSEIKAIYNVVETGNFTMGKYVQEFENEFASFFGSKYAVMSNSGSSANLLAVAAQRYKENSNYKEGQEVIVPAVSWGTTYYPIHQLGYTLKFVDIDPQTLNANPGAIKAAINHNTVGIFAVNLLGNPSELLEIREIADQNNLFLLEDNCESMGALTSGKQAGTFGDIGTFSSYFSHHISTMEGGMCVTDDEELAQIMVSMRAHGWLRGLPEKNMVWNKTGNEFEDSFRFILPGYNLRPLELSGAIGTEQLKKIPSIIENRRTNAELFKSLFSDVPGIRIQKENGESSWFGFSLILTDHNIGRRLELVDLLLKAGIECRPVVAGNFTKNPVMRHLRHAPLENYPAAEEVDSNGLFVGNHHHDITSGIKLLSEVISGF